MRALEVVDQPSLGFYSRFFLVEKATVGWRLIIDLSALNGFVTLTKFWMETVTSVLGSIQRGDWMFLLDLKDAYFQIPIHPDSHPYIWFVLEGRAQGCKIPGNFELGNFLWKFWEYSEALGIFRIP